MPAHNGLRIIAPIAMCLNRLFKRKLHYVVIGGWLPEFLEGKDGLSRCLKKFDGIHVETRSMKAALEARGFNNIYLMPNCKRLHILNPDELVYDCSEPIELCMFSRVMKEKGVGEAIEAIDKINEQEGRIIFKLDIYGPIDCKQKEWFAEVMRNAGSAVCYKGEVESINATTVLKRYYALLFPTKFYTEGIPGTIIDAYSAGIPVVCSDWENCKEVVRDGETGIVYGFDDKSGLFNALLWIENNPQAALKLKKSCLQEAHKFDVAEVVEQMLQRL